MVNPPPESGLFAKGASVEVSSDEEGFRGAWYGAKILEVPPKSASKKRKKALVQYSTLLADDGSSLLTEHVDLSFIRPLPPTEKDDAQSGFEVDDVVDARTRDGWWTGVVRKVLEKSKYRVYFDNPPDVIEFEEKDLRAHWNWIDGKWTRPEKKMTWYFTFLKQSTGSIFRSGSAVEVNIDEEKIRDVWFPAIVIKENGDNTFLVKYQNSKNDDESGTAKVIVDSLHIRPTPPRYADRNYELLERVDTTYKFGWRSGVITKVLAGRRYNVFFKHGNEDKEFSYSDMRPNVEWTDGKWVSKSKEVLIASDGQEKMQHSLPRTQTAEVTGEVESSFSERDDTQDWTLLTKINKNSTEQCTPAGKNKTYFSNKKKVKREASNGYTPHSRPSKKLMERNTMESPLSVTGDQLKDMSDETSCKEGIPKTANIGTKFTKKIVIGEPPSGKSESPLAGAATQTASNDRFFCQHHRSNWMTTRQKVGSVNSKANNVAEKNIRARKSPSKGPQAPTAGNEGIMVTSEENNGGEVETETPIILGLTAKLTKTLQAKNSFLIPKEISLKQLGDQMDNVNESVKNEMENKEHKVGVRDQKRMKGKPCEPVVTSPKAFDGKEQNGDGGAVKASTSNEADLSKHKGLELAVAAPQGACRGRSADNRKTKEVHSVVAGISNMVDEDQPLSTWIGGLHSSGDEESRLSGMLVDGWNEEKGLIDVPVQSFAIDARGRSLFLDNDRSLPFVKKSHVWQTIESMDVFQSVPQKPHFQPLAETREEFREGMAIGTMISFANLFEQIATLHFDAPRDTLDSILESLNDLEKHGFDVTLLRHRLNELVSIREGLGQHLEDRKNVEREIIENTKEMMKFNEEMEEIEKKIIQLQERHTAIKEEKETKNVKISSLKLHVDVLNELIQKASHDFKKVVVAPWKFP